MQLQAGPKTRVAVQDAFQTQDSISFKLRVGWKRPAYEFEKLERKNDKENFK